MEVLDGILGWLFSTFFLPPIILVVVIIVAIKLPKFLKGRHFKAGAGEALVETGGKKQIPRVYIAGSKFVSPLHECKKFPLDNLQIVSADEQSAPSFSKVPVKVKWSAWIRADRRSAVDKREARRKANAEAITKIGILQTEVDSGTLDETRMLAKQKEISVLNAEVATIARVDELAGEDANPMGTDEVPDGLQRAIVGFIGKIDMDNNGNARYDKLLNELRTTLDAKVREVVASMTPEQLITDRDALNASSKKSAAPVFEILGFELLDFSVNEVNDASERIEEFDAEGNVTRKRGYFDNLAAEDFEEKRRAARILTAQKDKEAVVAEIARDIEVTEKGRELILKKADVQEKTAEANAKADYAERIRNQEQEIELTKKQAEVAVAQKEKERLAEVKAREVVTTREETEKQRKKIEAEALKDQQIISAEAKSRQDEIKAETEAKVKAKNAEGEAEAARKRASGEADAKNALAEAEASYVKKTKEAEAEGRKAVLLAEAEGEKAKLLAEAEGQKALADALAANDKVNLQVELARLQMDRDKVVAIETARVMASVGQNATIVDMGGSGENGNGGGLLGSLLGDIPKWLFGANVQNEALNGVPLAASVSALTSAILNQEPAHGQTELAKIPPQPLPESDYLNTEIKTTDNDSANTVDIIPMAKTEAVPVVDSESETKDSSVDERDMAWQELFDRKTEDKVTATRTATEIFEAAKQSKTEDESDIPADDDPMLVAEAHEIIADLAEEAELDDAEALELAQVVADIKEASGFDNDEVYALATKTVDAIKQIHQSGAKVNPRSAAQAVLDLAGDGKLNTNELVDRLGGFAKKAINKKRRR